jgi:hypothetical protein
VKKIEPIDIKDSCVAIQAWVSVVNRRCKCLPAFERNEIKRMGLEVILRMERLIQQVGHCTKNESVTTKTQV